MTILQICNIKLVKLPLELLNMLSDSNTCEILVKLVVFHFVYTRDWPQQYSLRGLPNYIIVPAFLVL